MADNPAPQAPQIQQTPNAPEAPAGVPEGQVLEGNDGKERIVYDYDEDGNQAGWHKEPV